MFSFVAKSVGRHPVHQKVVRLVGVRACAWAAGLLLVEGVQETSRSMFLFLIPSSSLKNKSIKNLKNRYKYYITQSSNTDWAHVQIIKYPATLVLVKIKVLALVIILQSELSQDVLFLPLVLPIANCALQSFFVFFSVQVK